MAWYFDLDKRRDEFVEKVKAIESDPVQMKEIRELTEQKIGRGG